MVDPLHEILLTQNHPRDISENMDVPHVAAQVHFGDGFRGSNSVEIIHDSKPYEMARAHDSDDDRPVGELTESEFAQCLEEADEETVGYYCRAWILHLFACILFPDATGDNVSWMWIHCLSDWDQAVGHLEVLARREWFQGQPPSHQPTWAYLWDQVRVPHTRIDWVYIKYTNKLDSLTASSVEWEPYGGEDTLPFQLSNVCGADDYFYRMRCPLICFYAVEYHLPDRVARQFGRNKKIFDLERHHQSYIKEWEEMHDNVDDNNEPHTNRQYTEMLS
ncbi:protein MAIN-LIKE 1-like [Miscanthus floridulus]|uniref:protein MAIN-LIKE 1-like n=1 Tax=Miscanthus floridulus TaxID=154761 RepID=UPI00345A520E